jgi:predicted permease
MFSDLTFALRMVRKNPGFTAVVVLSLALGIGAVTMVFSWIESVLLSPLPGVANQGEMVVLTSTHGEQMFDTVSLPDIKDLAGLKDVFSGVVGSQVTPACMTVNGHPFWVYGQIAVSNYFETLGVRPLHGRTFAVDDNDTAGAQPVLVLSEGCWRRRFNADPDVIGRTVDMNRHSFTIIGVAPGAFRGTMTGLDCDFWAPVTMHHEVANFGSLQARNDRWLHTQARLRPGVSIERAQAAVSTLAAQIETAYPDTSREMGIRVLPVWRAPYGAQSVLLPVFSVLFVVSAGVLLIVISNVANLLLVRATARRKEIAIRVASGAGRWRIVRQLLTESVLLALIGCAGGLLLAQWGASLLALFIPKTPLPVAVRGAFSAQTFGFSVALALFTGAAFGLVPALQASRADTGSVLKESGRGSTAAGHHWLRSVFVVVQIALALLLLVGAGLLIQGSRRARAIDLGFDPRHTLLAGLRIGMHGYTEQTGIAFYRQLQERLGQTPGVQSAALASWFPLGLEGGPGSAVYPEGYDRKPEEDTTVSYAIISPRYFETLRIPLIDGRDFNENDTREAPSVAVINETMARRFWPGQNPVGGTFRIWNRHATVVGVARTGKYRFLTEEPRPFVYFPYQQGVWDLNLGVAVRTTAEPAAFTATLRNEIRALDPAVEVWATLPMTDYTEAAFFAQGIALNLLVVLGMVALALAGIGIYGVIAFTVGQRTQEIGVRMALGARRTHVLSLVVGNGMALAIAGGAIGLGGALLTARLLGVFLHGVSPFDVFTYAGALVLIGSASLLACWLPARRATRVDPMIALRSE